MAEPNLLILAGGVFAILAVASLIGFILKRTISWRKPHAVIDNLNARIKAWWVLVALMLIAFLFGKTGVVLLFAFASFTALREFMTLTPTRRGDHYALAASFFVFLPAQYALVLADQYGIYSVLIPVYAFLALPIIAAFRAETARYMERVAQVQWGLMICVFCLSHVPAILNLDIPGFEGGNLLLITFLIIVVQASDVLQYVCGKLFGRRKVAPNLSPSKTWEGLIGGVGLATLLGGGLWWLTPFTPLVALAMAALIAIMGFFGGLVMSAIKRDRGVKDWGQMIEGHGGVLDRIDSLVFAAPIFFHLTRFFFSVS
ncbi:phosphatidate cytidylyltransferase [Rhodopseudomonas julia]|uniref:Phosphatidate cytidylyltransferase n=1 Tax=Rhodopseudomonas julia TaxID=200617 RepID=A0ABU0C110_9BRAD|nr:phosphatidate cytidylyltransferase [Rhodopseudomonas julia]MDQ0324206.1 phosphatidate cytidylyltransferase [Rhodopseudomonas julia]